MNDNYKTLVIDMSGATGLMDHNSQDSIIARGNLQYGDGFVSGVCNPFIVDGYTFPSTSTTTSIGTVTTLMNVGLYDAINDDVLFGDATNKIYKLDTFNDTTIATGYTITNGTELFDLLEYQIYEDRKLLYTYSRTFSYPFNVTAGGNANLSATWNTIAQTLDDSTNEPRVVYNQVFTGSPADVTFTFNTINPSSQEAGLTALIYVTATSSGSNSFNFSLGWSVPSLGLSGSATSSGSGASSSGSFVTGKFLGYGYFYEDSIYVNQTQEWTLTAGDNMDDVIVHVVYVDTTDNIPSNSTGTDETVTISVADKTQLTVTHTLSGNLSGDSVTTYNNSKHVYPLQTQVDLGGMHYASSYIKPPFLDTVIEVGTMDFGFTNADDTWLTETAVGGFYTEPDANHNFTLLSDNNLVYLFTGDRVHGLNGSLTGGYDGSANETLVRFPGHFTITDAANYRGYIYMGLNQSTIDATSQTPSPTPVSCGIYIWDRKSTVVDMVDYLPLDGAREVQAVYVDDDSVPTAICVGEDGRTYIYKYQHLSTASKFVLKKKLGYGAYPRFRHSIRRSGDKTIWTASDGNIYAERKNQYYKLHNIATEATDTLANHRTKISPGVIIAGGSSVTAESGSTEIKQAIIYGYDTSLKTLYPYTSTTIGGTSNTASQGDLMTSVHILPNMSSIRNANIRCMPTSTGSATAATIKYYKNHQTTPFMSKTVTLDETSRGYVQHDINTHDANALQIEVEWAAVDIDSDTFAPYVVAVEYEPGIPSK